ncbi:MAG: M67 family metallopeptidase [Betaproteobacteria bacterium]|nr:M67 family metallopeptidase [Betaproteobacteria bacterium]
MATLQLSGELKARIENLVRTGYPHETCGLLIGRQANGTVSVTEALAARNLNRERARDRFELDPQAFLDADRHARDTGQEVVGIWHSHPDHPARPSEIDRSLAWPGWSYVILSVSRDGIQDFRSWRLAGNRFEEEVIAP